MTPGRLAKVAIRGMGSNQHASCPGESPWQDIKPVVLGSSGAPPALLRRYLRRCRRLDVGALDAVQIGALDPHQLG